MFRRLGAASGGVEELLLVRRGSAGGEEDVSACRSGEKRVF